MVYPDTSRLEHGELQTGLGTQKPRVATNYLAKYLLRRLEAFAVLQTKERLTPETPA